jgi:sec-independent protein translocase protein TatA
MMFGSLGLPELAMILAIAILVFGPRKLPDLGRSLGQSIAEFKKATTELQSSLDNEIRLEGQRATGEGSAAAAPAASASPGEDVTPVTKVI